MSARPASTRQLRERTRTTNYKDSLLATAAAACVDEQTYAAARLDDLLADCASLAFGLSTRGERIGPGLDDLGEIQLSKRSPIRSEHNLRRLAAAAVATAAHQATDIDFALQQRQVSLWMRSLRLESSVDLLLHRAFGREQLGLCAARNLKRGQLVHDMSFMLFPVTRQQALLMEDQAHPILNGRMSMELGAGVKAGRRFGGTYMACGYARFMNHSCTPNMMWEMKDVEQSGVIAVKCRALRRIEAGEELVVSYGGDYLHTADIVVGHGNRDCKCPSHERQADIHSLETPTKWTAQTLAQLPRISWDDDDEVDAIVAEVEDYTAIDFAASTQDELDDNDDEIEWLEWDGDCQVTITKRPPAQCPIAEIKMEPIDQMVEGATINFASPTPSLAWDQGSTVDETPPATPRNMLPPPLGRDRRKRSMTAESSLDGEQWDKTVKRVLQFARGERSGTRRVDSKYHGNLGGRSIMRDEGQPRTTKSARYDWPGLKTHGSHVIGSEENPWVLDDD